MAMRGLPTGWVEGAPPGRQVSQLTILASLVSSVPLAPPRSRQTRPAVPARPGLLLTLFGLLLTLGLSACATAPRPTTSVDPRAGAPAVPPAPEAAATPELQMLVAGWRQSYDHSRTLEPTEADSILFFRYQALLAHLDPTRIPTAAPRLRSEAERLRLDVSHSRDAAWLRWQSDLNPPPEPRPAPEADVSFGIQPQMNDRVAKWIDYFTGSGRETFALWYWRSGAYRARMEEILREEGLPPDLVAVVFIESGFILTARSYAAAVGPWQFIRDTGKRYGLAINHHRDERRDFELATRAAARYLRDLYGYFNDWNLALAAYNCGENRVFREIARQKTSDFWSLDLPRQTEDYVPEFHAVLHILSRPEQYGFADAIADPIEYDTVELPGPVRVNDLASHCGTLIDDVKALNPSWLRGITPADGQGVVARLPKGAADRLSLAALPLVPMDEARSVAVTRHHKVRRGETLRTIARRYGLSVSSLARENGLTVKSKVRTGRVLRFTAVTDGSSSPDEPRRKAVRAGKRASGKSGGGQAAVNRKYHKVKRGETLGSIAARYNRSVAELRRLNGFSQRSVLKAGARIRVG